MNISAWFRMSVAALVLAPVAVTSLGAQSASKVTVDVAVGGSNGSAGDRVFKGTGGAAIEMTVGVRRHPDRTTTGLWAVALGARASSFGTETLECLMLPGGGCAGNFPGVAHVAILAGLERRTVHTSIRALVGPAAYDVSGERAGAGALMQLDASAGFRHVQLLLAARSGVIAQFSGGRLRLTDLGFGLRVQ